MTKSLLADAYGHHVWATIRLLDACVSLSDEQLATSVPGTYGSIIDTARHIVGADAAYLFVLTGEKRPLVDEEQLDLAAMREVMVENGRHWQALLDNPPDPEAMVVRRRDDGTQSHASVGIRLAQAIHHGTDHRSQICTALTNLGIEPPEIDAWEFGRQDGRVFLTE